MKKLFVLLTIAAVWGGANHLACAQAADTVAKFLDTAKAATEPQLGSIATDLTGKIQSLGTSGINDAVKSKLDGTLKSLTGGMDSDALKSAFNLVKNAKFTPDQLGLAKQVGNLASAYVVQKNFAALAGQQGEVAAIVNSLRENKIKDALPSLKNVLSSAKLTDTQKQLLTSIADKYAPGLSKAAAAANALKKLPGF
jgi:hypothetical protein